MDGKVQAINENGTDSSGNAAAYITLVQDGLTGAGEFQLLHAAARTGSLAVNVVGYADLKKAPELSRQSEFWQRTSRRLRLGGYKILLDGSPQGRTAWMLEPYAGGAR